jgi:hypothetical protein
MAQCEKTGANVYLPDYGTHFHCDAFKQGDCYIFNANEKPYHAGQVDPDTYDYVVSSRIAWDRTFGDKYVMVVPATGVRPTSRLAAYLGA